MALRILSHTDLQASSINPHNFKPWLLTRSTQKLAPRVALPVSLTMRPVRIAVQPADVGRPEVRRDARILFVLQFILRKVRYQIDLRKFQLERQSKRVEFLMNLCE